MGYIFSTYFKLLKFLINLYFTYYCFLFENHVGNKKLWDRF